MEMTLEEFIGKIDLPMLKDQKRALYSIRSEVLSEEQEDALTGIINLIDAIQDYAVDVMGVPKNEVFNLTEDE